MNSVIKQLDSVTINKIAAGEVIDRPASIVKELIENSLDAQANHIVIRIKDGGKELIEISDNGKGFHKDDLPIAPLRHTTSKISLVEDIYNTHTFGFRGEALASICHCAFLTISSKQKNASAFKLTAFKDSISDIQPTSHQNGTTISVEDLFHELPVRKKFLKSTATELSYIVDICLQFSLMHPHVSIILYSNDVEKINTTGVTSLKDLALLLYGKSLKDNCISVHQEIGPATFEGIISDPTLTFSNRQKQIISVNKRLIKNPLIYKSISESYRDLIAQRRFPLAILNIQIESSLVDVNIHPQKHDIKFINPGFIFDCIPKAITLSLQSSTQHIQPIHPIINHMPESSSTVQESSNNVVLSPYKIENKASSSYTSEDTNQYSALLKKQTSPDHFSSQNISANYTEKALGLFKPHETNAKTQLEFLQLLNTYIILKTPTGAYIIDQHAVHERILYEKIKDQYGTQQARQVLLVSEIVSVSLDLMEIFESEKKYFENLNFILEKFGQDQVVVREIPIHFQKASIGDLILSILLQLKEFPGSTRSLTLDQKEVLQRQACRAAIKAGQTLFPEEVEQLLRDFLKCPQNYTCPHGRPLFIFYDQSKFETLFLRK